MGRVNNLCFPCSMRAAPPGHFNCHTLSIVPVSVFTVVLAILFVGGPVSSPCKKPSVHRASSIEYRSTTKQIDADSFSAYAFCPLVKIFCIVSLCLLPSLAEFQFALPSAALLVGSNRDTNSSIPSNASLNKEGKYWQSIVSFSGVSPIGLRHRLRDSNKTVSQQPQTYQQSNTSAFLATTATGHSVASRGNPKECSAILGTELSLRERSTLGKASVRGNVLVVAGAQHGDAGRICLRAARSSAGWNSLPAEARQGVAAQTHFFNKRHHHGIGESTAHSDKKIDSSVQSHAGTQSRNSSGCRLQLVVQPLVLSPAARASVGKEVKKIQDTMTGAPPERKRQVQRRMRPYLATPSSRHRSFFSTGRKLSFISSSSPFLGFCTPLSRLSTARTGHRVLQTSEFLRAIGESSPSSSPKEAALSLFSAATPTAAAKATVAALHSSEVSRRLYERPRCPKSRCRASSVFCPFPSTPSSAAAASESASVSAYVYVSHSSSNSSVIGRSLISPFSFTNTTTSTVKPLFRALHHTSTESLLSSAVVDERSPTAQFCSHHWGRATPASSSQHALADQTPSSRLQHHLRSPNSSTSSSSCSTRKVNCSSSTSSQMKGCNSGDVCFLGDLGFADWLSGLKNNARQELQFGRPVAESRSAGDATKKQTKQRAVKNNSATVGMYEEKAVCAETASPDFANKSKHKATEGVFSAENTAAAGSSKPAVSVGEAAAVTISTQEPVSKAIGGGVVGLGRKKEVECSGGVAADEKKRVEELLLPRHPYAVQEKLPNGLELFVLPHGQPAGAVEVHMEVHVGSTSEGEQERGMAHLCEHVTYMGSRKREALINMHAETNAYTDFHHTVFFAAWRGGEEDEQEEEDVVSEEGDDEAAVAGLEWPPAAQLLQPADVVAAAREGDVTAVAGSGGRNNSFSWRKGAQAAALNAKRLRLAFEAMREVLEAPTQFSAERVNKERAAVISEASLVNTIVYRKEQLLLSHLHAETVLPSRFPIGQLQQLRGWSAAQLKRFHARHYRPENAAVYVVGDVASAVARRLAADVLGSIKARKEQQESWQQLRNLWKSTVKQFSIWFPPLTHRWRSSLVAQSPPPSGPSTTTTPPSSSPFSSPSSSSTSSPTARVLPTAVVLPTRTAPPTIAAVLPASTTTTITTAPSGASSIPAAVLHLPTTTTTAPPAAACPALIDSASVPPPAASPPSPASASVPTTTPATSPVNFNAPPASVPIPTITTSNTGPDTVVPTTTTTTTFTTTVSILGPANVPAASKSFTAPSTVPNTTTTSSESTSMPTTITDTIRSNRSGLDDKASAIVPTTSITTSNTSSGPTSCITNTIRSNRSGLDDKASAIVPTTSITNTSIISNSSGLGSSKSGSLPTTTTTTNSGFGSSEYGSLPTIIPSTPNTINSSNSQPGSTGSGSLPTTTTTNSGLSSSEYGNLLTTLTTLNSIDSNSGLSSKECGRLSTTTIPNSGLSSSECGRLLTTNTTMINGGLKSKECSRLPTTITLNDDMSSNSSSGTGSLCESEKASSGGGSGCRSKRKEESAFDKKGESEQINSRKRNAAFATEKAQTETIAVLADFRSFSAAAAAEGKAKTKEKREEEAAGGGDDASAAAATERGERGKVKNEEEEGERGAVDGEAAAVAVAAVAAGEIGEEEGGGGGSGGETQFFEEEIGGQGRGAAAPIRLLLGGEEKEEDGAVLNAGEGGGAAVGEANWAPTTMSGIISSTDRISDGGSGCWKEKEKNVGSLVWNAERGGDGDAAAVLRRRLHVWQHPLLQQFSLLFLLKKSIAPLRTFGDYKRLILRRLVLQALALRLTTASRQAPAGALQQIDVCEANSIKEGCCVLSLEVQAEQHGEKWKQAVFTALQEMRRMAHYGVTLRELRSLLQTYQMNMERLQLQQLGAADMLRVVMETAACKHTLLHLQEEKRLAAQLLGLSHQQQAAELKEVKKESEIGDAVDSCQHPGVSEGKKPSEAAFEKETTSEEKLPSSLKGGAEENEIDAKGPPAAAEAEVQAADVPRTVFFSGAEEPAITEQEKELLAEMNREATDLCSWVEVEPRNPASGPDVVLAFMHGPPTPSAATALAKETHAPRHKKEELASTSKGPQQPEHVFQASSTSLLHEQPLDASLERSAHIHPHHFPSSKESGSVPVVEIEQHQQQQQVVRHNAAGAATDTAELFASSAAPEREALKPSACKSVEESSSSSRFSVKPIPTEAIVQAVEEALQQPVEPPCEDVKPPNTLLNAEERQALLVAAKAEEQAGPAEQFAACMHGHTAAATAPNTDTTALHRERQPRRLKLFEGEAGDNWAAVDKSAGANFLSDKDELEEAAFLLGSQMRLLQLKNGIKVNMKRTEEEKGTAILRLVFPGGRLAAGVKRLPPAARDRLLLLQGNSSACSTNSSTTACTNSRTDNGSACSRNAQMSGSAEAALSRSDCERSGIGSNGNSRSKSVSEVEEEEVEEELKTRSRFGAALVLAARTMMEGGSVGCFTREQIEMFCQRNLIGVSIDCLDEFFAIEINVPTPPAYKGPVDLSATASAAKPSSLSPLELAFQLLRLLLSEFNFEEDAFARAKQQLLLDYQHYTKDLTTYSLGELIVAMSGEDPRFRNLQPEVVEPLPLQYARECLLQHLSDVFQDQQVELNIVGDIELDTVQQFSAAYIGSLKLDRKSSADHTGSACSSQDRKTVTADSYSGDEVVDLNQAAQTQREASILSKQERQHQREELLQSQQKKKTTEEGEEEERLLLQRAPSQCDSPFLGLNLSRLTDALAVSDPQSESLAPAGKKSDDEEKANGTELLPKGSNNSELGLQSFSNTTTRCRKNKSSETIHRNQNTNRQSSSSSRPLINSENATDDRQSRYGGRNKRQRVYVVDSDERAVVHLAGSAPNRWGIFADGLAVWNYLVNNDDDVNEDKGLLLLDDDGGGGNGDGSAEEASAAAGSPSSQTDEQLWRRHHSRWRRRREEDPNFRGAAAGSMAAPPVGLSPLGSDDEREKEQRLLLLGPETTHRGDREGQRASSVLDLPSIRLQCQHRYRHPAFGRVALWLLQEIVAKRMFSVLREEQRLTYDAAFEFMSFELLAGGLFVVSIHTEPRLVEAVLAAARTALEELASHRPLQDFQLEAAKQQTISRHRHDLKFTRYWLELLVGLQLKKLPLKNIAYIRDLPAVVESVQLQDVQQLISCLGIRGSDLWEAVGIAGPQPPPHFFTQSPAASPTHNKVVVAAALRQ